MIAIGSIYYLQDRGFFHVRFGGRAICRNPWIVEAFPGGTFAAARGNRETGHWEDVIISGRSDTASSDLCGTAIAARSLFASWNSTTITV